ncbi:hypothetical protein LV89_04278 [Arcicella aurantiaca]|uniref:Uncharacterized protein n=1 Tax=Arcicella aurantiaca TaxID=591202 RepID=A0A316DI38_9BACT|nr:hypothetical protein [Arcicella aurantiaca]PWK17831.1 hypothetical protein LV89_04278 [Arcicella aurantiaca]
MKTFEKWETEDLIVSFNLVENPKSAILKSWIDVKIPISDTVKIELDEIKEELQDSSEFYNEEELKLFVISRLLNLIKLKGHNYRTFAERTINAKIEGIDMRGRVELIVAMGIQKPRIPFFFIHEYKPEIKQNNDPRGQLLAAMLTAQELNNHQFPILGCYVIGKNWRFVTLENKEFSVSKAYESSRDDIFHIYMILMEAKERITKLIKEIQ